MEVRNALLQAKVDNLAIRREGLFVRAAEGFRRVAIEVIPLRLTLSDQRFFLVVFEESAKLVLPPGTSQVLSAPVEAEVELQKKLEQLQQELSASREYVQVLTEEYEATNEELKGANEEILSSNEELQSTNEELQTAKEEMQSANEELGTVNEELKDRNNQLGKLNDDLVNLLGGVNLLLIRVDLDLRIRRFSPRRRKCST